MTRSGRAGRIDWGHCLLLLGLAGWTAFYLHDAWSASARVRNLILILPASVLAFLLIALVFAGILRQALREPDADAAANAPDADVPVDARDSLQDRLRPLVLMGLFALYILGLPLLGFDVGSFLFLALALIADGERRPLLLVLYPLGFAVAATLLFAWLLPYPLPTLLL